mmetsp:Transcript_11925/g.40336  ORF Transcript_11925/g.40336 Transcript_11925/m.40336 type:complete len:247 (+) Transcript_11925:588-1328(+)
MPTVTPQKVQWPHSIPSGEGKAPPPLRRFSASTTPSTTTRACTLSMGVDRSASSMSPSSLAAASASPPAPPAPSSSSSSSAPGSPAEASRPCFSPASSASALTMRVSSDSPAFASATLSCWYFLMPLERVRWAVAARSTTRDSVRMSSGRTLFTNEPTSAPPMVSGSMTMMRSQSTRGRSASGCRLGMFSSTLVMLEPKMVTLLRGMASLGWNPKTSTQMGTRMPPPPIPPDAAMTMPTDARRMPE